MYKIPNFFQSFSSSKLNNQTIGIVDDIQTSKYIRQTPEGGKISTLNYIIDYHFKTNDETHKNKEYIPKNSINSDQIIFLNNLKIGDSILLHFNSNNPNFSKIQLKPK